MVKRVREPEKEKSAKKVAFSEETPDVAKEEAEAAQPEIDVIAAKQKRRDVVLEGAETKLGVGTRKAEEGIGGNEKTNADKYQEEMGHMMTGFNTREERQEGDFTDEGTYQLTMKRDPWLFQLDQKQESRGGQVTSEGMFVKNIETKSAKKEDAPIPATTALMNVLRHLEDGETVNNAVKRLGKAHDSKKKAAAAPRAVTQRKPVFQPQPPLPQQVCVKLEDYGYVRPLVGIRVRGETDGPGGRWVIDGGCSHSLVKKNSMEKIYKWPKARIVERDMGYATETKKEAFDCVATGGIGYTVAPNGGQQQVPLPKELRVVTKAKLLPNVHGVLGADFLMQFKAVLFGWQQSELRLLEKGEPHTWMLAHGVANRIHLANHFKGLLFVPCVVSRGARSKEVMAMLDMGSTVSVIPPDLAEFLGCSSSSRPRCLSASNGTTQEAGSYTSASLAFPSEPSTTIALDIPFQVSNLSMLRHHKRRLKGSGPVILVGLPALRSMGTLGYCANERACWWRTGE